MNTPFYIARRYIFSKKSHSVINIIAAISSFGIFVSTTAMIIVLSGFNGIENLVEDLYSSFDADIKITVVEGKTFPKNEALEKELLAIEGVDHITQVIEEITMIKHEERWITATMKGVEDSYLDICNLRDVLYEGSARLNEDGFYKTVMGIGLASSLQTTSDPRYHDYITVYGLLRDEKITRTNQDAFKPELISVGGIFTINPEFDNNYFLVPIEFSRSLLEYGNDITAYELGLDKSYSADQIKNQIQAIVGSDFEVKTRYEQNEMIFKTNETEKWMVFLILGFILLLSTFNIIASLTMLIFDKKQDIKTLISMGADTKLIKRIFFLEGFFINVIGGIAGILVGLGIAALQIQFHFVKLENSVIDYWPVKIEMYDVVMIFLTVLIIGIVSSMVPVNILVRRHFKDYFK